ncbi:MAG TPA: ATP-binding protein [Chthoniobacterales bacterium]|nr:ATP-binding protein [Chthoniobacterales bacterium]
MSATETVDWATANQRYLMAALAVVRSTLERHAAKDGGEAEKKNDDAVEETLNAAARGMPAPSTLEVISAAFRLSPFERDVLLLCAGVELDSTFGSCCAAAQGDSRKNYPTFSLALAALPGAHWSALAPSSALRRWRLIEVTHQDGLVAAPLGIEERVLHFLAGINHLDERLAALLEPVPAPTDLPESQVEVARQVAQLLARSENETPVVVELCGPESESRRGVAAMACGEFGLRVYALRASDIPAAASEREMLARLWEREALLSRGALLVDADEIESADQARTLLPFLEDIHGLVVVTRREPLRAGQRPIVRFDVPRPSSAEQRKLWNQSLGQEFGGLNGEIESVIAQFSLGPRNIQAVCANLAGANDAGELSRKVWAACRLQSRARLDDLAQRIEPAAAWDELVLPPAQHQLLREITAHVRQRLKVYETWGFAEKGQRGLGISALFAGSSGTGKTMAAEVLARELCLDLYRIDLSSVVSKYIGETEKNLRRVFDAAEEGGAILLFDEADALFGKRSEVKDSHDRYANIEVSYLLQRMEAYRGLAILTTNLKSALDPAFLRRLRFIVQFPFPDASQRAEIWRHIFPAATPTRDLDLAKLSRLNIPGGNIRNIALNAAFLAADANEPVTMPHLLRAARSEYAKLEKPLTESEIGGWA